MRDRKGRLGWAGGQEGGKKLNRVFQQQQQEKESGSQLEARIGESRGHLKSFGDILGEGVIMLIRKVFSKENL